MVGAGATYEITEKKGEKNDLEIAVVGAETIEGQSGHWLEMTIKTREGVMVMKNFIVLKGKETPVLRMIIQAGGEEAMEFPMQMMGMGRGPQRPQKADVREGATRVGTETITVPAGTFACEHYKTSEGDDVWVSEKVSPWGMVKFTGKDSSMVLQRTVSEAKTKIKGTPRKFDMQEMMRRPS